MHLAITRKDGVEYACLAVSIRKGTKVTKRYEALGRIVDRGRNVFYNRKRGLFTYSLETGEYGEAPRDIALPARRRRCGTHPILDFGDTYLLSKFIEDRSAAGRGEDGEADRRTSLKDCLDGLGCEEPDTLLSMVLYYIVGRDPIDLAEDWAAGNYAGKAFPEAELASQRIGEFLVSIGNEESHRAFFRGYLKHALEGMTGGTVALVQGAGMPDSPRFPADAIQEPDGEVVDEVGLIQAVHLETGLPLYFRCSPGITKDAEDLAAAMSELESYGAAADIAVLDPARFSSGDLREFRRRGIPFLLRLRESDRLYGEVLEGHLDSLRRKENLVRDGTGHAYLKCVEIAPGTDDRLFVYLGQRLTPGPSGGKAAARAPAQGQGIFLLAASRRLALDKILPCLRLRRELGRTFDLRKAEPDLPPSSIRSEDALGGHLLLAFLAAAIRKELQIRLEATGHGLDSALLNLRNQKCRTCKDKTIPQEPAGKTRELYHILRIDCPAEIAS